LSPPSKDLMAALAATRFGMGARPGEIDAARSDPRGFLTDQIRRDGADQPQGDGDSAATRFAAFADYRMERRAMRQETRAIKGEDGMKPIPLVDAKPGRDALQQAQKDAQRYLRDKTSDDFLSRAQLACDTPTGFRERWALFFANHFTVSATKQQTAVMIGPFEREAIRPNVFGRFEDLLVASSTHPAMLTYLDQAQSIGPTSRAAGRGNNRRVGLNENLAREILELHTVGVDGGYAQADVTEFARALTGFSIGRAQDPDAGAFLFRVNAHEPGQRSILGARYAEDGEGQGLAVLKALANDRRTARHVCGKLARHFVADDPPPALVARLEKRWMDTGGRLDEVAQALVEAPEAWDPDAAKIKTPYEFVVSTWRAVGGRPEKIEKLNPILTSLNQKPFTPPSPKGWPEEAQAWASPDGLIKRMQWAQGFASAVADTRDPDALARSALGARLSEPTARAVARAETRREAFALLVMSPEFQRR